MSPLPAVPASHSYCRGISSLRCATSRVVTERWSPFVLQGSIHPSSGFHTAVAASSGVLIAVVGAPAVAAVVPPSVLPVSNRPPGVPPASGFSVTWAFLSGSWVVPVPVVLPEASVDSVVVFSTTISSPSVVASTVPPGFSVIPTAIEASVCVCIDAHRGWGSLWCRVPLHRGCPVLEIP